MVATLSDVDDDQVAAAISAELRSGPLSISVLADRLVELGVLERLDGDDDGELLADWLVDVLIDEEDVWLCEDDVVALVSTMLDGSVFTRRVSDGERVAGVLHATPDLDVIDYGDDDQLVLDGGGRLVVEFASENPGADEHGSFVGPLGWLGGAVASTVVVAQRGGVVTLSWTDDVDPGAREARALRDAFDARYRPGVAQEPMEIVLEALAHDASLFRRAVAPVGELLESVGLECRGAWVGLAGEDAEPPWAIERERRVEEVAKRYSFDRCCHAAFERVTSAWLDSLRGELTVERRRTVARDLAHSLVAPALVDYVLSDAPGAARLLEPLAMTLADLSGSVAAPGRYLLARVREADGLGAAMETALRSALVADAGYEPALKDLAWCACDRGDAARAVAMLERITQYDVSDELEFLEDAASRLSAPVGRNEPCPCGSGRKYKVCCSSKPALLLERRVGWLQHKLLAFAMRPLRIADTFDLFVVARTAAEIDDDHVRAMLPLLGEVAALSDDAIDAFLVERGALLPDDEVALVASWRGRGPSLYQVRDVVVAEGVTLFDTRSAETTFVHDVALSGAVDDGDYLFARVVPVGSSHQFIGQPVTVTLAHRASLLSGLDDPTPERLAMWIGGLFATPHMVNREGEETVLGRAVFAVTSSPSAVTAQLDGLFGPSTGGRWSELVELDGESVVRSFINLDGDSVEIVANSRERLERTVATLSEIDGLALLETESPIRFDESDLDRDELPTPPELEAALATLIAEREVAWLDESIPALGGYTPREAAADPSRREDLIALLNEFERRSARAPANTFDAQRLRRALGIG